MLGYDHNQPSGRNLVSRLLYLSVTVAALCVAPAAFALDTGDIVITSVKGEVHVTMSGAERAVRAGALLELPATVRTGSDGAIELKQGATTVGVGPDTLLEFPALASRGGSIDRIVQPRGNAFYSIGKRADHKLRIETPYLVAVVKGTQFNVVAQDGATTISLFEGLLEVRSSDDNGVIDLHAGEIATRSRVDAAINVMKMAADKPPPAPPASPKSAPPAPSATEKSGDAAPVPKPLHPAPESDDVDTLLASGNSTRTAARRRRSRSSRGRFSPSASGCGRSGSRLGTYCREQCRRVDADRCGAASYRRRYTSNRSCLAPRCGAASVVATPATVVASPPIDVAPPAAVVAAPPIVVAPPAVNAGGAPGPVNVDLGVTAGGTGTPVNVNLGVGNEDDPGNSGKDNGNSNGNSGNANGVSGNGNGNGNNGNGNGNGGANVTVTTGTVVDDAQDVLDKVRGKSGKLNDPDRPPTRLVADGAGGICRRRRARSRWTAALARQCAD